MSLRPIRKLLVANRGEIAVRIIRSARTMGIRTAAVYSEADAGAMHVAVADEAYPIGPPEPIHSYLNVEAILAAARAANADAVHPGYGFLSERPEFARAVTEAGLLFIGPPASVMAALGDKLSARRLATTVDVPVVPGLDDPQLNAAARFGAQVGFPILVKASAGGGGRGMRVVESPNDLESALESASGEAASAFGDGRVFLEKYLPRPRHIEVQILADSHGRVIALGERECSLQRRHQKIVEESPAPGLSATLRGRLLDAAVRIAQAAGYRNAGTAEFLVAEDQFYFLEVNARLQVEHPVTELRYDRDLVCDQLAVASGEHVIEPGEPHGAAIECRINAEDAAHDFRPATGKVMQLQLPAGPGVRIDTCLTSGAEVSPYYDSLIAKLICYGHDREMARRRTLSALKEFSLLGIHTTASFLRDMVASEAFAGARLSTGFVPEFLTRWRRDESLLKGALLAAALGPQADTTEKTSSTVRQDGRLPNGHLSPWATLAGFTLWRNR